jgi:hypothetical protein
MCILESSCIIILGKDLCQEMVMNNKIDMGMETVKNCNDRMNEELEKFFSYKKNNA